MFNTINVRSQFRNLLSRPVSSVHYNIVNKLRLEAEGNLNSLLPKHFQNTSSKLSVSFPSLPIKLNVELLDNPLCDSLLSFGG